MVSPSDCLHGGVVRTGGRQDQDENVERFLQSGKRPESASIPMYIVSLVTAAMVGGGGFAASTLISDNAAQKTILARTATNVDTLLQRTGKIETSIASIVSQISTVSVQIARHDAQIEELSRRLAAIEAHERARGSEK